MESLETELPEIRNAQDFVRITIGKNCVPNNDLFHKNLRILFECSNNSKNQYKVHTIKKRNGKDRRVYMASPELRYFQDRIKEMVLDRLTPPQYAYAYIKGRSIKDNAEVHLGNDYMLKLDIKDFFESCTSGMVWKVFEEKTSYESNVITLFTKLCTRGGHLVQGAVTSGQLANFCLERSDLEITEFLKDIGGKKGQNFKYSRYSDDITISSDKRFNAHIVASAVKHALEKNGFRLNGEKTKTFGPNQKKIVCGVRLGKDKLSVDKKIINDLRSEIYFLGKSSMDEHLRRKGYLGKSQYTDAEISDYLRSLIGRISFVCDVEPGISYLEEGKAELQYILRKSEPVESSDAEINRALFMDYVRSMGVEKNLRIGYGETSIVIMADDHEHKWTIPCPIKEFTPDRFHMADATLYELYCLKFPGGKEDKKETGEDNLPFEY